MAEFFLILGVIVIYFAPLLVAAWMRHPKLAYIGGLNAALGVTVVGWAGALVWALRRRRVVAMSYHGDMEVPRSFNTGLFAAAGLVVAVALIATMGLNRLGCRAWRPLLVPCAPRRLLSNPGGYLRKRTGHGAERVGHLPSN